MRLVFLPVTRIRAIINSVLLPWVGTPAGEVLTRLVNGIVNFTATSESPGSDYAGFVQHALSKRTGIYINPLEDPTNSPLDIATVTYLVSKLNTIAGNNPHAKLLIADRMDILCGSGYAASIEGGRFDLSYYELIYSYVYGELDLEDNYSLEDLPGIGMSPEAIFDTVISILETVISIIERDIVVAQETEVMEDLIALGVVSVNTGINFLLM